MDQGLNSNTWKTLRKLETGNNTILIYSTPCCQKKKSRKKKAKAKARDKSKQIRLTIHCGKVQQLTQEKIGVAIGSGQS